MGGDHATSESQQIANAYITQNYAGSCSVECDNTISGLSIEFINSVLGGNLEISQVCSANAQCIFNSTNSALADVAFSAQNSTTAAPGVIPGITSQSATSASYQQINESILQSVSQKCNVQSANSASNVSIFAENSTIGGSVIYNQTGTSEGQCQFTTTMNATDIATGSANNCSGAGKKAKKACGGKGSSSGNIFLYVGAGILALMMAGMAFKAYKNFSAAAAKS